VLRFVELVLSLLTGEANLVEGRRFALAIAQSTPDTRHYVVGAHFSWQLHPRGGVNARVARVASHASIDPEIFIVPRHDFHKGDNDEEALDAREFAETLKESKINEIARDRREYSLSLSLSLCRTGVMIARAT